MSRIEPQDVEKMKTLGDVKGLIEAALGYWNDSMVRESAARALGRIGDPRAVEPLIVAFGKMPEIVAEALDQIGLDQIGDSRAVEPLIANFQYDSDYLTGHTSDLLIQIGTPAVEPLIAALQDSRWEVRFAAARALGRIGDPRAVEPLIAALKEEDGRSSAARAPGEIGDARAVEPLIFALKDEDIGVRSAAAKALDEIGIPAS
jgi:HEAT repeat protein